MDRRQGKKNNHTCYQLNRAIIIIYQQILLQGNVEELCEYLPRLRRIYTSPLSFETVATTNSKGGQAECNHGIFLTLHQQTKMKQR
jgi:hypothetical protein